MEAKTINLDELTDEQLEQILAEKKEKKRLEKLAQKDAYERDRNTLVVSLISEAVEVFTALHEFKQRSMQALEAWMLRMKDYGDAKEEQQNFQLVSADGNFKVVYATNITKRFDERAKNAEEKLKEYLEKKVKKRDKDSYKLIMSLLERNTVTGELDISNINRLYKMEEEINDETFSESMALFRESYSEQKSKIYARFFKKAENNKWQPIVLDFAAV